MSFVRLQSSPKLSKMLPPSLFSLRETNSSLLVRRNKQVGILPRIWFFDRSI
ncbi:hypothetical protein Scep_016793 [Stephania cephalantha]|uniref:Uncharacterized protein n=1 Tax=Stephania cephalantha TaxID=152367 RepID=A0AAP0INV3_9MAGN